MIECYITGIVRGDEYVYAGVATYDRNTLFEFSDRKRTNKPDADLIAIYSALEELLKQLHLLSYNKHKIIIKTEVRFLVNKMKRQFPKKGIVGGHAEVSYRCVRIVNDYFKSVKFQRCTVADNVRAITLANQAFSKTDYAKKLKVESLPDIKKVILRKQNSELTESKPLAL